MGLGFEKRKTENNQKSPLPGIMPTKGKLKPKILIFHLQLMALSYKKKSFEKNFALYRKFLISYKKRNQVGFSLHLIPGFDITFFLCMEIFKRRIQPIKAYL
jgi:hypothetical protein